MKFLSDLFWNIGLFLTLFFGERKDRKRDKRLKALHRNNIGKPPESLDEREKEQQA